MECYQVESEFIDSLDFLSPPVKRIHSSSRDVFVGPVYNSGSNNVQVFEGLRNKYDKNIGKPFISKRRTIGAVSSTSLILKKTSERRILETCSFVSYTTLQKSNPKVPKVKKPYHESRVKPLIRVTVIPKTDQIETAKLLRKHRRSRKLVQSTLSNQENSIETKNVFVIVAGRKRDKIYEIKTTGSAKFSSDVTDNNRHISFEGLTNVKPLIQSLNMNQTKPNDPKSIEQCTYIKCGNNACMRECFAPNNSAAKTQKRSSNSSRLRIFGQLGLTEDDRCVLRYGASVKEKPDCAQLGGDSSCPPPTRSVTTRDDNTELRKNASVQANHEEGYRPQRPFKPYFFGESQGTQVNFNVQVSTRKRYGHAYLRMVDQHTQCSCKNISENENEQRCIKDCQSPLVIISVYPKTSPEDITGERAKNSSNKISTRNEPEGAPIEKINKSADRSRAAKNYRQRDKLKPKKDEFMMQNKLLTRPRTPSPVKDISGVKEYDNYANSKVLKTQFSNNISERCKIANKNYAKDKQRNEAHSPSKFNPPNFRQIRKKSLGTVKSSPRVIEKGTNTEHARAKKVLVDNYTKKLTEQWNQKDVKPTKLNTSKVRINIDGEHEFYNVILDQGYLTTDLKIRKNVKDTASSKCCGNTTTSLENLFAVPNRETTVNPMSMTLYKRFDDTPATERISGLNIRDSLEISHRRENKNFSNMKNTQTCFMNAAHCNERVTEAAFLAPVKHYVDDDCSITDPIERDKEIKELLAINKAKAHSSDDGRPYSCFYQSGRSNIAQINLVKLCPCLKTTNTADTEDSACLPDTSSETCCHKTHCNITHTRSDLEQVSPSWCRQEEDLHKNVSYFKSSNCSACPNKISSEQHQQCHQQLHHQEQQRLLQQQQQQQKLYLQKHRQRHQQDYKTGCGSCPRCAPDSRNYHNDIKHDNNCDCACTTMRAKGDNSAIYQQLILNRNIQVFLQVEQFSKQKPIVLSRKQYDKVKRTIQSTIQCCRDKRNKITSNCNASNVSVSECRKKCNIVPQQYCDQEVQTDLVPCNKEMCRRGSRKNRTITKTKCSTKFKCSRPDKYCHRSTEESSSIEELLAPPNQNKKKCFSSSSEDDDTKCDEGCKLNAERYKQGHCRYSKFSGERCKTRFEPHKTFSRCCRPTLWAPSGFSEYNRPCGDRVKTFNAACKSKEEQLKINKELPDICGPFDVESYKSNQNLQKCCAQNPKMDEEHNNLNIDKQYKTAEHYKVNIPYTPSKYRKEPITNPVYKKYDEPLKKITCDERQPTKPNDQTLTNLNDTLEQHVQVNGTFEKSIEASRQNSGYPNLIEHRDKPSEVDGKNGSDSEVPPKLNGELDLSKHNVQFGYGSTDMEQKSIVMLYNVKNKCKENPKAISTKNSLSSMEIRYTSMAYMRHIDFSTSNIAVLSDSSVGHIQSFKTIFRGHRKSPTPNLGTSIFSPYTEKGFCAEKTTTFIMAPKDVKPTKKPFLRRLMSCLVMRSTKDSDLKLPPTPEQEPPNVNSSIDSYHISTSLGAVEVSSSIYDTSASFYSNHTIIPINSKIKRSFFSSVRGFLTNRKS